MTPKRTVLVCGSRSWKNPAPIKSRLKELPEGTTVIHGGAAGADRMAGEIAHALGLKVRAVLPKYYLYGKRAPLERNTEMLLMAPSLVIAFWDNKSTGTKDTLTKAEKMGIPIEIWDET